jgi:hypothetical protein
VEMTSKECSCFFGRSCEGDGLGLPRLLGGSGA